MPREIWQCKCTELTQVTKLDKFEIRNYQSRYEVHLCNELTFKEVLHGTVVRMVAHFTRSAAFVRTSCE